MKIDRKIWISEGLKSESEADSEYGALSLAMLNERLAQSSHVSIVSAYYDSNFLRNLFHRKNSLASITMIFNRAAASGLPGQLDELRDLKRRLQLKHGMKTVIEIKVASKRRFLHTKLYHFRRGKWARTPVGSANATSNGFTQNDEILVEIHGRNETIEGYIDWVSKKASSCEEFSPDVEDYNSLQSLLRDGFVYFKSNRVIPYTLDCFDNQPKIAEALKQSILANRCPFMTSNRLAYSTCSS